MNEAKEEPPPAEHEGQQLEAIAAAMEQEIASAPEAEDVSPSKQVRPPASSSLANKIAAFASGVAPVKQGITNASEDAITVEDVLHKLESASRAAAGSGKADMQLPLVRSAYEHLVAARSEAERLAKELQELKSSRVQAIPPSAWIKREHKYKMDLEKYEHTISMQQQRIERLELEVQVLREGAIVKPLEERIAELECQLVAASEEKTQVQSKYHELSIKHRQLIETSPQIATIWNEVLIQQNAAANGDAATMQRLTNFDLRHTGASSGLSAQLAAAAAAGQPVNGVVSPKKLPGVASATAIFNHGGPPPVPAPPPGSHLAASAGAAGVHPQLVEFGSIEQGPETPVQYGAAVVPGQAVPRPGPAAAAPKQPQTAEERANALMAAVALEGLSPEASIAALQQLNYDLTMQLGVYQQMVGRLKDGLEQSDLEKAELEADKVALEAQLTAIASADLGAPGSSAAGMGKARPSSGWSMFWRRTGQGAAGDDDMDASSVFSLSSSRRSSGNLDDMAAAAAPMQPQESGGGASAVAAGQTAAAGSTTSTDSEQQQQQQQEQQAQLQRRESRHSDPGSSSISQQGDGGQLPVSVPSKVASAAAPSAAASGSSGGGLSLFTGRRQRAAVRATNLQKDVKELKRQLKSVQEENKFLVQNLVEIKMELAETQSNHDQAKRALVRAMDKESCLDMRVTELSNMLDMATQLLPWVADANDSSSIADLAAASASIVARMESSQSGTWGKRESVLGDGVVAGQEASTAAAATAGGEAAAAGGDSSTTAAGVQQASGGGTSANDAAADAGNVDTGVAHIEPGDPQAAAAAVAATENDGEQQQSSSSDTIAAGVVEEEQQGSGSILQQNTPTVT